MSTLPPELSERSARARLALDGLSVGDAFGQCYFQRPEITTLLIERRALAKPQWPYTDDTEMAIALTSVRDLAGMVDCDLLATTFAARYSADPYRGYGGTAHDILQAIASGEPWQDVARKAFDGSGSMGNGAAMRVAPLGAWFADDFDEVADQAASSADPTHAHPEGKAGAVAVAVASAYAWRRANDAAFRDGHGAVGLLRFVYERTPDGDTSAGIGQALALGRDASVELAVSALGNGSRVTAPDTVPFALWCAARHLDDYEEALWTTVSGLGDRDTTCAIVGGIVALSVGREGIPREWLDAREPLDFSIRERSGPPLSR
jgi:ADP-ribosylglycohydrolase